MNRPNFTGVLVNLRTPIVLLHPNSTTNRNLAILVLQVPKGSDMWSLSYFSLGMEVVHAIDMCIDMPIGMCIDVYRHVYSHVYRHVYRHAYRHVYTHVYRHVYSHVYRHSTVPPSDERSAHTPQDSRSTLGNYRYPRHLKISYGRLEGVLGRALGSILTW